MNKIWCILSLAANMDSPIQQLDVKNSFLHGDLEEEVYMDIPLAFSLTDDSGKVCKLRKYFYGLKQLPIASLKGLPKLCLKWVSPEPIRPYFVYWAFHLREYNCFDCVCWWYCVDWEWYYIMIFEEVLGQRVWDQRLGGLEILFGCWSRQLKKWYLHFRTKVCSRYAIRDRNVTV